MNLVTQIENIKKKISGKISFNDELSKFSWFNLGGPTKVLFRPKILYELSIFLKEIKGENKIKVYQFNTKVAKHHFCSECGIQTHNQRRSDPNTYGINMGCIDDIEVNELFKFKTFINDGQNHIKDRK